jgi:hypothetical protein
MANARTDINELAALPETVRKIALDEEPVTLAAKPSSGPSPNSGVGFASFQSSFPDCDSRSSGEIGLGAVLNNPAGLLEQ